MIKQSNATSTLLDQLVKAAQTQKIEPKDQAKHFADQIIDMLKVKEPSLSDICRSAINQSRANKIAQIMDSLPEMESTKSTNELGGELGDGMDMGDEMGDEMGDGMGEGEVPVDDVPLDQEELAGDPTSIINQITDLLEQLKQSVNGGTAEGMEDLGEAPIDDVSEEPLGDEMMGEEPLGDELGIEEEAPMPTPAPAPMPTQSQNPAPMPMVAKNKKQVKR